MDERTARSGRAISIRQTFLWVLLPTLVLVLGSPSAGDAQVVVTNITPTTGTGNLGTTVTQVGNSYNITGGTRPGSGPNLFHSFGDFSVGAGDIGNFLNNTGLPTTNILGRVTGGNISNIYGTIQTTGFEPDSPIRRARR
jgi:large exoprotein involved in heme utilization and adhesion